MIVGLVPPDSGRVLIDGEDITAVPMYLRAREYGISYLPQEASVFRKLTVEENIMAVLEVQPINWQDRRRKKDQLIDELGLGHIHIILLTAKGQEFDRKRGQEVGADLYMTKPFDPDALIAKARSVLGLSTPGL